MPLAHIILHVAFCSAILRTPSSTPVALHVHLTDRTGRADLDRTFTVDRGDETEGIVEFDSSFGVFRLDVAAPKYGCSATNFLTFISGHTRAVTVSLDTGTASPQVPVLLSGTAPQSFLYVKPTFVLFDKSAAACNKPIPAPQPAHVDVENDQDAYYASLYNDDSSRAPGSMQLALRLQTPTHQYHYVRLPVPFPMPPTQWPSSIGLNVSEDMVDELATEPTNTLLCPRMWQTSAG